MHRLDGGVSAYTLFVMFEFLKANRFICGLQVGQTGAPEIAVSIPKLVTLN
jgi:hypothetical protein